MFVSHYVDRPSPFTGNDISEGSEGSLLSKYITDYDRRTYELYFSKGDAARFFEQFTKGISLVSNVPDHVDTGRRILEGGIRKFLRLRTLLDWNNAGEDLNTILDTYLKEYSYEYINELYAVPAGDQAALSAAVVKLEKKICDDLKKDYGDLSVQYGKAAAAAMISAASGVSGIGVLLPFAGVYIDIATDLMNKANFVTMRRTQSFRVADRTYYYWGETDGRN